LLQQQYELIKLLSFIFKYSERERDEECERGIKKIAYVITTVLFLVPFNPETFTRADTGIPGFAPTISILMGFPSKRTLLYRLRAANASLLLVYTTSAEPYNQV
jgi:hypothetical protein